MKPDKRQKDAYRKKLKGLFGEEWKNHFSETDCLNYKVGNERKVEQIEIKTGSLVKVHRSMNSAAREMGVRSIKAIWKACNGELKTAYGYRWKYENCEFADSECLVSGKVGRPGKQVAQIDPNTNRIIQVWESVAEAQRKTKTENICKCCQGLINSANGFIWRYLENGKLGAA